MPVILNNPKLDKCYLFQPPNVVIARLAESELGTTEAKRLLLGDLRQAFFVQQAVLIVHNGTMALVSANCPKAKILELMEATRAN